MRNYICALIVCLFIVFTFVGCDEVQVGKPVPPTSAGSGAIYFFQATSWGKDFHQMLNDFLAQHAELKIRSITPIEHDSQGNPQKYIVVFDLPGGGIPAAPVTEPSAIEKP